MIHCHGLSVAILEGDDYHQDSYAFGAKEDVSVGVDLEDLGVVLIGIEAVNYGGVVFWLLPLGQQGLVHGLSRHAGVDVSLCLVYTQSFRLFCYFLFPQ